MHYRYDITGNIWTLMAPIPVAIYEPATGVIGGQVYVIGGGNPFDAPSSGQKQASLQAGLRGTRAAAPEVSYSSTYVYNIASDGWSSGPNTNVAHSFTGGAAIGSRLVVVGGYNGTADTNTVEVSTVTACASPTPTPNLSITGTVVYCTNPALPPIPGVTMTLTGTSGGTTTTDGSGNYSFTGLTPGGNYTVTPTKAGLVPGSTGINTVDVVAIQRHFLVIGTPLTGCKLAAADVNGVGGVNTVDVVATQRFFLALTSGIANVGKHSFMPPSTSYTPLITNQTAQNYNTIVFGDVNTGYVHRPDGGGTTEMNTGEVTVASVALPDVTADQSASSFTATVRSSAIDAKNNLVGFQGDLTFDERVVTFESEPVRNAGLTAGNWNVSGNVLPGPGPVRTLRISAFSTRQFCGTSQPLKLSPDR